MSLAIKDTLTWERYWECWQAFVEMERKYEEALAQIDTHKQEVLETRQQAAAQKVPMIMTTEQRSDTVRRMARRHDLKPGEIARSLGMAVGTVREILGNAG
jgi:DNA-binding transcriptional regulator YiaG